MDNDILNLPLYTYILRLERFWVASGRNFSTFHQGTLDLTYLSISPALVTHNNNIEDGESDLETVLPIARDENPLVNNFSGF